MPQLNPTPWFMTLITTWIIITILLKLTLTTMGPTQQPHTAPHPNLAPHWSWTWQ
uniref:ATP synthase complex subunit 8 n=1 Tax=Cyrtodactylus thirakhupti TaxID=2002800 RepID=A0A3G9E9D2_9SAUR|nr:ATP synthase F0 subunit 8 [Cyrtodactylus thirakhupti]